jgi:hypothetical protein
MSTSSDNNAITPEMTNANVNWDTWVNTKNPLQCDDLDGQLLNGKWESVICNRKSEHPTISIISRAIPIPEPNNNTPANNENNPNENVGQQPPCCAMDTERHGPVMEDVDEQDGQSQPRSRCFNQGDSEETVASDGTEFMAETQIQLKNVEEIHNEENLCDGKVFMDL